jgi:hypothetical protein
MGFGFNASGFDDVYILTLPSFVWIKWYPTSPGPGNPHHSLTCNVVSGSQMLVIGGTFPLSQDCDVPEVWGTHNLNLGKDNPDGAKWYQYLPNITEYKVPSEIIAVVGGSAGGGATVLAPSAGWSNRDLPVYFTRQASIASRTPTRSLPSNSSTPTSPPPKKVSTGVIVGATIGSLAAVLIALLTGCCFFIRRKKQNAPRQSFQAPSELAATPLQSPYMEQKPETPGTYSLGSGKPPIPELQSP